MSFSNSRNDNSTVRFAHSSLSVDSMGEPGTPPPGFKRGRQIVDLEDSHTSPHSSRSNIRRRSSAPLEGVMSECALPVPASSDVVEFLVYLPNATSVELRVDEAECKNLTVQGFVELVRVAQSSQCAHHARSRQKQRELRWTCKENFIIRDFQGNQIPDGRPGVFLTLGEEIKAGRGLLLYDHDPDTVHSHKDFWNVTPEPHLLQILPQDYSVFSALADELDNSLQAVYQLETGNRLICVDFDQSNGKISIYDTGKGMDSSSQNSISKWGTMGSSVYRCMISEAIGIPPPYLKPNFGMFGLGGVGAGFHLGKCITVSSKTKCSDRVVVLYLSKDVLETNVKAGSVWKTGGEFRSPTEQELQWSPHGSFTKVEISNLNREISSWKVGDVQRKLKDFYFPYIQNDDGACGMTSRPVEIRVNGEDLAGVMGGEVAHTNFLSGVGEPFVLFLEFTKPTLGGGYDKAHARITCHYFPYKQGREAIDDILAQLKEEDPKFMEPGVIGEVNFENYSRRSIRRLGRLLPSARGGRLPFMEPKKGHKETDVSRHCYKRAKAFIDMDAGFVPTHSKTNLDPNHAFTEALYKLGSGLQTVDSTRGLVTVTITHNGTVIKPEQLHIDYKVWITANHKNLDTGAVIDVDSAVIVSQPHHKEQLNIKNEVFRVVYYIDARGISWKVGKAEVPRRLKLQKGLPGLNNGDMILYGTLECFISEGFANEPGDTRIILRPMGVPEERGSREIVDVQNQEHSFILGESRAFPFEILFSDKCEVIDEPVWRKHVEISQGKAPALIDLLNEPETFPRHATVEAGAILPREIIAIVRPNIWKDHVAAGLATDVRRVQKYIVSEPMEMDFVVGRVHYHPPDVTVENSFIANVERVYEAKATATAKENLKGLYCFSTTGTKLENLTRQTGTYFLLFTLLSEKYKLVRFAVRINVRPSSKIGCWKLCFHPGHCNEHHQNRNPEVMRVRLGGELSGTLHLSRVDEFGNPKEFEEIPSDIKCGIYSSDDYQVKISTTISKDLLKITDKERLNLEIPKIKFGQGNLDALQPTMQAVLRVFVGGSSTAAFQILVLPGELASAHLMESDAHNGLHPGQIIENMMFQMVDSHQNPVLSGEKVKVVLEGFKFQDKVGNIRSVDTNGCLDLGVRLRVTAGYGELACLELLSLEDLSLCKKSFRVIFRRLQSKNVPESLVLGSELRGVQIEAVDENGQVDQTMDGVSQRLTVDWNHNISVPLRKGVCTLPSIRMLNPGMWEGRVSHAEDPCLKTHISVWVERAAQSAGDDSATSEDPCYHPQGSVVKLEPHIDSQAIVLQSSALDTENALAFEGALRGSVEKGLQLEKEVQILGRKLQKQEEELGRLVKIKKDHETLMEKYQAELEKLSMVYPFTSTARESLQADVHNDPTTEENQLRLQNASSEDFHTNAVNIGECMTPLQVEMKIAQLGNPAGTNAAALMLQAQRQKDYGIMRDVIGVVALMGAVENEEINRALVAFLGLENMLAIICRSTRAADCFAVMNEDGSLEPNQGLYGFAARHKMPISGRYRVITLADESRFFMRRDGRPTVDNNDPQKLLNIKPITMAGSERTETPHGSLGYAVNLIHLNEDQLSIRISGRYGLRESLFFELFGFLEVFDSTTNMLRSRKDIRSSAVATDGGLIRASNQFETYLMDDPILWFPKWVTEARPEANQLSYKQGKIPDTAPAQPMRRSIPFKEVRPVQYKQRKEMMKAMDSARRSYIDEGVEKNILKLQELCRLTSIKISEVTQIMRCNAEETIRLSETVLKIVIK